MTQALVEPTIDARSSDPRPRSSPAWPSDRSEKACTAPATSPSMSPTHSTNEPEESLNTAAATSGNLAITSKFFMTSRPPPSHSSARRAAASHFTRRPRSTVWSRRTMARRPWNTAGKDAP
jgi:hypothetical protein